MRRTTTTALLSFAIATGLVWASPPEGPAETHWTQWRGPERGASVEGSLIPGPGALSEAWRVEVGEGQSSPVVGPSESGGEPRIFLHSRWQDRETVQALDRAKGAVLWRTQFDEPYTPYPGARSFGKGPKSTPALDDGRLCTLSVTGTVTCLDAATGDVLWRRSYGERFAEPYPPFGTSMSPLFDAGRLVVHVGGHPEGALLAIDPATGEELWSYEGEGPGYSSPIVANFDGTRQIVTQAHRNVVAVDAESGRLLWSHPSVTPCDQNIVTPTRYRDLLIFSSVDGGVYALRPRRTEEGWRVEKVWHNQERSMYMSSPVVVGEDLVGFSQRRRGELFALEAATGRERWASESGQGKHAALVGSGDGLLAMKSDGDLVLFEAQESGFSQLTVAETAEGEVWTHPVPVSGGWLIKDDSSLHLFRSGP